MQIAESTTNFQLKIKYGVLTNNTNILLLKSNRPGLQSNVSTLHSSIIVKP